MAGVAQNASIAEIKQISFMVSFSSWCFFNVFMRCQLVGQSQWSLITPKRKKLAVDTNSNGLHCFRTLLFLMVVESGAVLEAYQAPHPSIVKFNQMTMSYQPDDNRPH
jgi:hypothetical protein